MAYQKPNSCRILEGKKFESVKKFPRFRSSHLGSNTIDFRNGKITWSYSDLVEEIVIYCQGETLLEQIIIIGQVNNLKYEGKYSLKSKELIWEGETYQELIRDDF